MCLGDNEGAHQLTENINGELLTLCRYRRVDKGIGQVHCDTVPVTARRHRADNLSVKHDRGPGARGCCIAIHLDRDEPLFGRSLCTFSQSRLTDEIRLLKMHKAIKARLKRIKFGQDIGLPLMNDATAACQAEHTYGRGKEFQDYAYFFIGAFIGGGVVLNSSVYTAQQGNAGALGSLRSISPIGESMQLIDMASIHQLEDRLREVDIDTRQLWDNPESWTKLNRYVEPWLLQTAQELAKASLSVCSVIDFEAILIDGSFPASLRDDLVARVRRYVATQDTRGLIPPRSRRAVLAAMPVPKGRHASRSARSSFSIQIRVAARFRPPHPTPEWADQSATEDSEVCPICASVMLVSVFKTDQSSASPASPPAAMANCKIRPRNVKFAPCA